MKSVNSPYRFSIAPMMEWTDRHCRFFHRLLSRRARLYTEMVTTGAVIHGKRERLLGFSPQEMPVALQLGGSDIAELAQAALIGEQFGYAEINLNAGCPSDRVKSGRFGACLMAEPQLVGECIAAMKAAVQIPVTLKCRIGIDEQDTQIALDNMAQAASLAGVDALIVHARKAWLKGLSPKDNRTIPPLDYERVYRLKTSFPSLPIILNGGIATLEETAKHLRHVDGVMMGRAAYHEPWRLLDVDTLLFDEAPRYASAYEALPEIEAYISEQLARGVKLSAMTKHLLTLFHSVRGARSFRRLLTENATKPGAGIEVWRSALAEIEFEAAPSQALAAAE